MRRGSPIWFVYLIVLFFGMHSVSRAGDSIGVAGASVIRMQLQSIANEVINQANLDPNGRVALWVQGEGPQSLTENAFVEVLQRRSFMPVLRTGKTSEQALEVFLLSTDTKIRALNDKYFERDINIKLEVRTIFGPEREVRLLGSFHRETKDTAQVFPALQLTALTANEEESLFERLATPLIIISGALLVVLLLFTVRS
jgi:hypothetical protein